MNAAAHFCAGLLLWSAIAVPSRGAEPASRDSSFATLDAKGKELEKAGDCEGAKRQFEAAVKEAERFGPGDPRLVAALSDLGAAQQQLEEDGPADDSYRRALAALAAGRSSDHVQIGALWHNVGLQAARRKRAGEAEKDFKNAVAEFKKTEDRTSLGKSYMELAGVYYFADRDAEAERLYRKAVKILRDARANAPLAQACENLAMFLSFHRRISEAWGNYRCALIAADASTGLVARENRTFLEEYAKDLRANGLGDGAPKIDAIIAKIDALPPPKPGLCTRSHAVMQEGRRGP